MRVVSCSLQNFASYKKLEFDFTNHGLALIQGPTGSGKSTICDAIPWVLFGITAKGGPVSDVISWPGDKVTTGAVLLHIKGQMFCVARVRGSAKDNDLYYSYYGGPAQRGKDLNDTQRLIDDILGVDAELYLSGAYFHEFSQTAQFFTTTAKNRRTICEQIVDLSLAKKLQPSIKDKLSVLAKQYLEITNKINMLKSNIEMLLKLQITENNKAKDWDVKHERSKQEALNLYDRFEASRKKTISNKCRSCGTILEEPKEVIDTSDNPYLLKLEELELAINPHEDGVKDFSSEIESIEKDIKEKCSVHDSISNNINDLDILLDITAEYRSVSISNAISSLEEDTNRLLTEHFDAEIRVLFSAQAADKIDVIIAKNDNNCNYTQLSKGQRQLLKLCFGIAIMKCVSNHNGIKFDQIFLDEAFDGLDDVMKTKAYGLLLSISQEYESIFVVEHSNELKTMFPKSFTVSLINGESQIEET